MLREVKYYLVILFAVFAVAVLPITAFADDGGVVTEGITTDDDGESEDTLASPCQSKSISSNSPTSNVVDAGGEDNDTNDQEQSPIAEEEENTDDKEAELYLWMSAIFNGHDCAMDSTSEGKDIQNDVAQVDLSAEMDSDMSVPFAGGCNAAPSSALGILVGLLSRLRRRRT